LIQIEQGRHHHRATEAHQEEPSFHQANQALLEIQVTQTAWAAWSRVPAVAHQLLPKGRTIWVGLTSGPRLYRRSEGLHMMMLSGTLSCSQLALTGENKELTKWVRVWTLEDEDGSAGVV